MHREIKELEKLETKLEELKIEIFKKQYRNETRGLGILMEQEIELKAKE